MSTGKDEKGILGEFKKKLAIEYGESFKKLEHEISQSTVALAGEEIPQAYNDDLLYCHHLIFLANKMEELYLSIKNDYKQLSQLDVTDQLDKIDHDLEQLTYLTQLKNYLREEVEEFIKSVEGKILENKNTIKTEEINVLQKVLKTSKEINYLSKKMSAEKIFNLQLAFVTKRNKLTSSISETISAFPREVGTFNMGSPDTTPTNSPKPSLRSTPISPLISQSFTTPKSKPKFLTSISEFFTFRKSKNKNTLSQPSSTPLPPRSLTLAPGLKEED